LNGREALKNTRAGSMRGNYESSSLDFLRRRDASGEVVPPGGCHISTPLGSDCKYCQKHQAAHKSYDTILRLAIANDAASQHFAIPIQNPNGIRSLREWLHVVGAGSCSGLRHGRHSTKARQLRSSQIVQEFLSLVGSDLKRLWKPQQKAAVDQGNSSR